jgi:thioredoxin-related protein/YHS domain-containing protein/ElaB/YqjD/DUF883 family membrane-anchored ribosome-binding protein
MAVRAAFAAVLLLAFAAGLARAHDQLPWAADFAQACQQANAQGKLVLIHFYSDDCPPCVRVERNVFSQAAVAEAVGRSCVPVKVHARNSHELATKYRVQQWPTDVFVTPAGIEVTRSVSPQSPDAYIAMTNSVAASAGVSAFKNPTQNIAAAQPQSSPIAPWAAAPQNAIAQVNAQATAVAPWMAQSAADAKSQAQQSAQQIQHSAQQFQQGATQQAQQSWQYAQGQANQALTNTTQAAQQTAQTAQQSTQAAADAAKEVINRYAQPMASAPPAVAPYAVMPPTVAPVSGTMPWEAPAAAQTLPPASPPQVAPAESNPALAPSATVMAAGTYPVAMGGYCPVTLATEKKWKKGQPQFGVMHRRRTFLFASEIEQKKFLLEPDRFSPVMTGYDPVKFMQTGELVDGSPAYSLTYRKQVYLFTSDAALKSFWQNPAQFNEGLRQAMTQQERGTQLR